MNIYGVTNAEGQTLSRWDINDILEEMGISEEAIKDGSSTAIEKDAAKNKIDLDQLTYLAKQEGATEVKGADDKNKEAFETELANLGIPAETIAKGKDAVMAYASQNGIELPKPPSGTQMNFIG